MIFYNKNSTTWKVPLTVFTHSLYLYQKSDEWAQKRVKRVDFFYINNLTIPQRGGEYSREYIRRQGESRYISTAVYRPWGDSCFSIYQISWIKLKKVTFCKLKTSPSRNFVYSLQTFGFCHVHFTILLQIQDENNLLPTSKHRQAKVRRFLVICLYECFIYRSNFIFPKCLETRRHLASGHKTVNIKAKDIPSYGSETNRAKIVFHWFGKY